MRDVIVESSIAIAAFRHDPDVLQRLNEVQSVLTATVLGELYYGANRAAQTGQQLVYIQGLVARSIFLSCDEETARQYGVIKDDLRRQGQPIPENDLWIAASALQHRLPLATRDTRHFPRVPGLVLEIW